MPANTTLEKVPDALSDKGKKNKFVIPKMNHPIMIFHTLLVLAKKKGIGVRTMQFESKCKSMLYANEVGIKEDLRFNEIVYELAYELVHAIIHCDKGNMLDSQMWKYYNEQAERTANMMIELLDIREAG